MFVLVVSVHLEFRPYHIIVLAAVLVDMLRVYVLQGNEVLENVQRKNVIKMFCFCCDKLETMINYLLSKTKCVCVAAGFIYSDES